VGMWRPVRQSARNMCSILSAKVLNRFVAKKRRRREFSTH